MNDTENYHFYKPYLTDQEQVLWTGMPEKGRLFTGQDLCSFRSGLCGWLFPCFGRWRLWKSSAPLFSSLFGLPFIGIGVYLVFGVFIQRLRLRGRTFYAITNKKIMIKRGNRIAMYDAWDLPPMSIRIHKNGNGTIVFQETVYGTGRRSSTRYFALENIADFEQAQNAISRMDRYQAPQLGENF